MTDRRRCRRTSRRASLAAMATSHGRMRSGSRSLPSWRHAMVHAPWTASPMELSAARVRLGFDYPRPIVDHPAARARALDALARMKADA